MSQQVTDTSSQPRLDALHPHLETTLVTATEAAALAAARLIGRGDQERTKAAAAQAMLESLDQLIEVPARIVLTPGGDAILSPGSVVGRGGEPQLDLAVYPAESAGLVARGLPNAVSIVVATVPDGFPTLPSVAYVEKIAVGPPARGGVDLDDTLADNLRRVAFARDCRINDLVVAVLDRPRHQDLVEEIRSVGARVLVLEDGDVAAAMSPSVDGSGVDAMLGIGGVQEGIMGACAMRCLGGDLQLRLWPRNDEELILAGGEAGRVYKVGDLSPNDAVMAVSGISGGVLLEQVRYRAGWAETDSLVMSSRWGTVRRLTTRHLRQLEAS